MTSHSTGSNCFIQYRSEIQKDQWCSSFTPRWSVNAPLFRRTSDATMASKCITPPVLLPGSTVTLLVSLTINPVTVVDQNHQNHCRVVFVLYISHSCFFDLFLFPLVSQKYE